MNAPIFIVGTPRSGTTLTAKILGRHSKLYMPGETHFFDDVYSLRHTYGEDFPPEVKDVVQEKVATLYGRYNEPEDQKRVEELMAGGCDFGVGGWQSYRDALTALMEYPMISQGKERWGNNAPRDIFHVSKIIDFYPDAKVIVCVRDVRDFLLSYKGKWRATATHEVERLKKLYHPVVTSLLWKSSMRQLPGIKAVVPEDNLLILQYEHLVTSPQEAVKEICSKVGVEFEETMLEVETYGSAHGQQSSGIFSTSVGRWRDKLDPEEAWIAQRLVGPELTDLGYEIDPLETNALRTAGLFLSTPVALFRALHANRHKRGPLLPYLAKRLKSLVKA